MNHFPNMSYKRERERVIWDKDPRNLFKLKDVELHVPAQKKEHTHIHTHTFESKTNKIQQVAVSSAVVLDSDKDVDFLGVGGVRLPSSISTSSSSSAMDTMDMRGFRLPGSRKGFPWAVLGRKESPASPGKEQLFMGNPAAFSDDVTSDFHIR